MEIDLFDICLKWMLFGLGLLLVLMAGMMPFAIYDLIYVHPVAAENANKECQYRGFDFYESFTRKGFLSEKPLAVKCKYVEQYRDIDLNIREEN